MSFGLQRYRVRWARRRLAMTRRRARRIHSAAPGMRPAPNFRKSGDQKAGAKLLPFFFDLGRAAPSFGERGCQKVGAKFFLCFPLGGGLSGISLGLLGLLGALLFVLRRLGALEHEPAHNKWTAPWRMSSDLSGPLGPSWSTLGIIHGALARGWSN